MSNLLQLRDQLELVLFSIRIKLRVSESRRENLSFGMLRNNVVARQCAVDVIVYREHFLRKNDNNQPSIKGRERREWLGLSRVIKVVW